MITPTLERLNTGVGEYVIFIWANMAAGDIGELVSAFDFPDRSVQIVSNNFDGASVTLEMSNDGTHRTPLHDPQGSPLTFAAEKGEAVTEATKHVGPTVTGGGAGTSITVVLFCFRRHA